MTLKEAVAFIDKKNKQLQARAEKHTEEAAKIRANIKLVVNDCMQCIHLSEGILTLFCSGYESYTGNLGIAAGRGVAGIAAGIA